MKKDSKIYVAGHRGLVGSAILRKLQFEGYTNLVLKTRSELDLLDQKAVEEFFKSERIEYVFLAAAKVGGIMANKTQKADFIYENLEVQNNVLYNAWKHGVKKLLFLGSSCIYPRMCPQPIKEEYLLTGLLEETNDAYAISKIAGIMMSQSFNSQYGTNFVSVMPTNQYGPNDNYNLETSHVLPALIRRFHDAKISGAKGVVLWGSGSAKREFMYIDDLADAVYFLMKHYDGSEIVNIGTGKDISIRELAEKIKDVVGFKGEIRWDSTKPDGMPRKQLDVSKLHGLGWRHKVDLEQGLRRSYKWFVENHHRIRK
ncbi:MAG: GDP-L-fucose synthase [Candidatus Kerfeldbacteria bacterium]